jgi:hypothetical protein
MVTTSIFDNLVSHSVIIDNVKDIDDAFNTGNGEVGCVNNNSNYDTAFNIVDAISLIINIDIINSISYISNTHECGIDKCIDSNMIIIFYPVRHIMYGDSYILNQKNKEYAECENPNKVFWITTCYTNTESKNNGFANYVKYINDDIGNDDLDSNGTSVPSNTTLSNFIRQKSNLVMFDITHVFSCDQLRKHLSSLGSYIDNPDISLPCLNDAYNEDMIR